jgi:AraC-like DNA-binding protein
MLKPLFELIAARDWDRDLVPEPFWSVDSGTRLPLDDVHAVFERAVERLGDEQVGLTIGSAMHFGAAGPFDYAVRSAATVRDSVQVAARYSKVYTDSFCVLFETWRRSAFIRLLDEYSWPRPAADFAMSACFKTHVSDRAPFASGVEAWFPYSAPEDTSRYERTFAGAVLRFGAPFFGFSFDRAYESAPMPGADALIHTIQCDRLDALTAHLPGPSRMRTSARSLIDRQLRDGRNASALGTAHALHMSRRTLSRRLEQEGTSFAGERDYARRELAMTYVRTSERPLTEIAFSLGFSHVESFHRAFKRWTGETPRAYRERASVAPGRVSTQGQMG